MIIQKNTKFSILNLVKEILFSLTIICCGTVWAGSPQVTYQGRILTAGGSPVARPVQFKLQVRSPGNEDCILYEEVQNQDLTSTSGVFSLALNGSASTRTDGGSYSFSQIFANRGTLTLGSGKCATGTTYVTGATDNRNLKVYFNDGGGWESLPLQAINQVPLSVEAAQVGGYPASSILRVDNGSVPGTASALTTANFTELMALLGGISTHYTKASSNGTTVLPQSSSPSSLTAGQLWYDSGSLKYYNGTSTVTLDASGSAITYSQLPVGTASNTIAAGNDSRLVNAIQNAGYASSIQVGADASLPSSHSVGRFYVASDTQKIYYDNGTVWITVGLGNVTSVSSGTVVTALGYTPLKPANNLSDLASSATARSNLGLGTASLLNTGTASGDIPVLGSAGLNVAGDVNITGSFKINGTTLGSGGGSVSSVTSANSYLTVTNGTTAPVLTVNVGTTSSTVAAGNDSRITGALQASNNLSDLTSSATARSNLGLGTLATSSNINLASQASGTLAATSLPNSGVTSGTYGSNNAVPSITVDIYGRITAATSNAYQYADTINYGIMRIPTGSNLTLSSGDLSLTASNVISALGYTPAASGAGGSSQWATSGTTISYMTGNVGIGNSNPSSLLHVGNVSTYINATPSSGIGFQTTAAATTAAGQNASNFFNNFNSNTAILLKKNSTGSGDYLAMETSAGVPIFYVKSSGYTGIGVSAPSYVLDVSGTVNTNTAINISGLNALRYPSSDSTLGNSIAIGASALASQTATASYQNVAIGANALANNTAGIWSTAVGANALNAQTNTGANTAVGRSALSANATGTGWNSALGAKSGISITTGAFNTAIGGMALGGNSGGATTGSYNTAIGYGAAGSPSGTSVLTSGSSNTIIGSLVGSVTLATGSSNILIGSSSAVDVPTASTSNFLNIGNTIFATGVGSGTLTAPAGNVGIRNTSPAYTLDVSGTINTNTGYRFPDGTVQTTAYTGGGGGGGGTVSSVTSANSYLTVSNTTTTPVITANVGTSANTLAAGNDSRITGALQASNNLSDLASSSTARTNLGLGNSGATAGTYGSANAVPSLTVDALGRITSVASSAYQYATTVNYGILRVPSGSNLTISSGDLTLTASNVVSALGYTPAASGAGGGSSQWTTGASNIYYAGNVQVGNQTSRSTSASRGQLGLSSTYSQTSAGSVSVNWDQGNMQEVSTFVCNGTNTITFTNLNDGGAYTLLLSGSAAHVSTCLFSATGLTFKTPTGAVAPVSGKDILFTFTRIGSTVIYNMSDNLQ